MIGGGWKAIHMEETVWEGESALHFRHGKLIGELEPGRHVFWGRGHRVIKGDTRVQQLAVATQEIATADGISVKMSALLMMRISDPVKAHLAASNITEVLYAAVQLALRDVVTTVELESLIPKRQELAHAMQQPVARAADTLGVTIEHLSIRDIILPGDIKSAMHEAMSAQKKALAQLEVARGEAAAMRVMTNVAKQYANHPELMKLKYLEVLDKASTHGCNTFVVGGEVNKSIDVG